MALVFLDAEVEITIPSAGSWVDVDLSAYVPVGATGVLIHILNTHTTTNYRANIRKNGSTLDLSTYKLRKNSHVWHMCGLDANRVIESYSENLTYGDFYLCGYTTSGFTFLSTEVDKSPATTGSYVDVDCSDVVPSNAVGLIFEVWASTTTSYGVRKNGMTVDYYGHTSETGQYVLMVPCDASQVIEAKIGTSTVHLVLIGYVTADCGVILKDTYDSLTFTRNTWSDLPALPAGGTGVILMGLVGSVTYAEVPYGARRNGSEQSFVKNAPYARSTWSYAGADANGVSEAYLHSGVTYMYLAGYAYEFRMQNAEALSDTVVEVTFSTAADQTTAEDETKWTLTKQGGGTVPSFTATRQVDTTKVQLEFAEALAGSYDIEATSVLDTRGLLIAADYDMKTVSVLPPGGGHRAQAVLLF